MNRKAIILGIKGIKLTLDEKRLIKNQKPWGIILFSRNIKDLFQLKSLIKDIRLLVKDKNYPILIDQEGGRVSRLNNILDVTLFPQGFFGNLYKKKIYSFITLYKIYIDTVCNLLNEVGININTIPVLDIKRKSSHKIIGDRSFSDQTEVVSKIGKICVDLCKKNKIGTVIKHVPGHGLSKIDSHYNLPIVNNKKNYLKNKDFKPFKDATSFFAMTAHVVYSTYDNFNPATHSKIIINDIIRDYMHFKGILISDDICMKALKFSLTENATKALDAGCNIILHCNGKIKEMNQLVKLVPKIDSFTQKKTSHFYKFLG